MLRQQLQKEESPNVTENDKKQAKNKAKKAEKRIKINDEPAIIGEISVADFTFSISDL